MSHLRRVTASCTAELSRDNSSYTEVGLQQSMTLSAIAPHNGLSLCHTAGECRAAHSQEHMRGCVRTFGQVMRKPAGVRRMRRWTW